MQIFGEGAGSYPETLNSVSINDLISLDNNYSYIDNINYSDLVYQISNNIYSFNINSDIVFELTDKAGNVFSKTMKMKIIYNSTGLLSDVYNYPNPFNTYSSSPGTTIRYMLTNNVSKGRILIIDPSGSLVHEHQLTGEELNLGTHHYYWNGYNLVNEKLGSGVYFGFLEINGNITHSNGAIFIGQFIFSFFSSNLASIMAPTNLDTPIP